ncbi:Unknown protein [Striga hermonthica]|uniref:Uncharacterized protein n=1 Tax=Striga hermonthica TaxID=68872 RepID=A0A9N7RDD8_STRHE|nr:Unknown protein [Striga hermonthica]
MAKRRGRPPKKPSSDDDNANHDAVELQKDEDSFQDHEEFLPVERQSAAIRAIRDVEIEQLVTMLQLFQSNFSKEQLQVPVLHFSRENFQHLSINESGEAKWKNELNNADERTLHASLLRRLSMAYPDYSAYISSMAGVFEFSNKPGKTGICGADNGELLLFVHGSPRGDYKEDNMETIQEAEDG